MEYSIYRTYLVRYRATITAPDEKTAIIAHRKKLENRVGSVEDGSLEVLNTADEISQLQKERLNVVDCHVEN